MDHFEDQFLTDAAEPLGLPFDEEANFFHPEEVHEGEEFQATQHVEESIYTDDPVRVYLREMGSVPLLTREGEVELARRMERGKFRMQKAISRSALIQNLVVGFAETVRKGEEELETFVDLGETEEGSAADAKHRKEVMLQFMDITTVHKKQHQLYEKMQLALALKGPAAKTPAGRKARRRAVQVCEHTPNKTFGEFMTMALDMKLQGASTHILHDHVNGFIGAEKVFHPHNIGVTNRGERAAFFKKTLEPVTKHRQIFIRIDLYISTVATNHECRRQVFLDGYRCAVFIARQIHNREPTRRKHFFDRVVLQLVTVLQRLI